MAEASATRDTPNRASRVTRLVLIPLAALVAWSIRDARSEGDTAALVDGAGAIRRCLSDGVAAPCDGVVHFPLFQYVPAVLMGWFGVSSPRIVDVLAWLSAVCVPLLLLVVWRTLRRREGVDVALGAVAVVAAGPLLLYARSSFGEVLAALLIAVAVATVVSGRSWWRIALAVLAAGLTKEPAILFVGLLVAAALLLDGRPDRASVKRVGIGFGTGAVLSVAATLAFNWFRFGSLRNTSNLDPLFRVHDNGTRGSFFAGQWLSPSAGMWVTWPLACAVLVLAVIVAFRRVRDRQTRWQAAPAGLMVMALVGLTAGFSLWYAPFGWHAWAHRLMIPWIPAVVMISAVAAAGPLDRAVRAVRRGWMETAATAAVATTLTLPTLGSLFYLNRTFAGFFLVGDETCPKWPPIQTDAATYYTCVEHFIWSRRPFLTERAMTQLDATPWAWLAIAGLFLGLVALLAPAARARPA